MSLADQKLDTMPAGNPQYGFGVDAAGRPVLYPSWVVLATSAVAVSHTGNTSDTALATISIPAGLMGANGIIRVTHLWSVTNNANNKTPRVWLNGLSGTAFLSTNLASVQTWQGETIIRNRNSQSSQVGHNAGAFPFSSTTGAIATATIDTSVAVDLVLSGILANSADTITLQGYTVELLSKS